MKNNVKLSQVNEIANIQDTQNVNQYLYQQGQTTTTYYTIFK